MAGKPLRFTKHAVTRILSLGFTEEDVEKVVAHGKKRREGKAKFKAALRTKKGFLIVTCLDHPDHILIVTIGKGGERRDW